MENDIQIEKTSFESIQNLKEADNNTHKSITSSTENFGESSNGTDGLKESILHLKKSNENILEDIKRLKKNNDKISCQSSSSEESDCLKKGIKKGYELKYNSYKRSKSTSDFNKSRKKVIFSTVKEEKEDEIEDNFVEKEKFKKLNLLIQNEGYDNVEESLSEHKPKNLKTRSNKCLSLMDPVIEVKEEIDFNQIKDKPFKKFKVITDVKEDSSFGNVGILSYSKSRECDDAIEEDNRENELEIEFKPKYHTTNLNKIPHLIDNFEHKEQKLIKNWITEEIKEDNEHEELNEDLLHNPNCKIFIYNSKNYRKRLKN